jgi:hypothetical protein
MKALVLGVLPELVYEIAKGGFGAKSRPIG